jgi:hypothetical protein
VRTTGHPTPLHWAALGLSALAAAGWTSQLFLPWASDGLLSQSTGLDVWTLWRGDLLPDDAAAYAPALLVLPALSVLLLAMLGLPDGWGQFSRSAVAAVGSVTGFVILRFASEHVTGIGPGLLAVAGASTCGAVAVLLDLIRTQGHRMVRLTKGI